jgi:hypothetical protein
MAEETGLGWSSVRERLHELSERFLTASRIPGDRVSSDEMSKHVGESMAGRCRQVLGSH